MNIDEFFDDDDDEPINIAGLLVFPWGSNEVPICPDCDEVLAILDSAVLLNFCEYSNENIVQEGKVNQHYFVCSNEDCPSFAHVFTAFHQNIKKLYRGCYSKAYPDKINIYNPFRRLNDARLS